MQKKQATFGHIRSKRQRIISRSENMLRDSSALILPVIQRIFGRYWAKVSYFGLAPNIFVRVIIRSPP